MNDEIIYSVLSEILECDIETITKYNIYEPLADIGMDSLHFIKLIVKIEDLFGFEINDSDLIMANFATIYSINLLLERYISARINIKKVIITDCDNVLWRGVAGEEDLTIDYICTRYHKTLRRLQSAGLLICICSKNQESEIQNAFQKLNIPVDYNSIVVKKINKCDKATNIGSIAQELNLSTNSFVFLDDSDYELGLVSSQIEDITVIKASNENDTWINLLDSMFDNTAATVDRTKLYLEQKKREKSKVQFNSVIDYNLSLNTTTTCDFATFKDAERISELSQRTNQFNLSSCRYSISDINVKLSNCDYAVLTLSASDIYGDMGLVGCAIIHLSHRIIEAFMLSCRVFGRGFELILLEKIKSLFPNEKIYGVIRSNNSNALYSDFYSQNGIVAINNRYTHQD